MLVLTRYKSERIVIGDEILITVDRVKGGKVFLGIDAPREIPVTLEERYNKSPLCKQNLSQ